MDPTILRGWHRRGYGPTQIHPQLARGLPRTPPDDWCTHPPDGFPPRGRLALLPRRGAGHDPGDSPQRSSRDFAPDRGLVFAPTAGGRAADVALCREPAVQLLHAPADCRFLLIEAPRRSARARSRSRSTPAAAARTCAVPRVAARRERHRDLALQAAPPVAQLDARATPAPSAATEAATRSVSN